MKHLRKALALMIGFTLIIAFIISLMLIQPPFDNLIPIAGGLWRIIGSLTIATALALILPNLALFQRGLSTQKKTLFLAGIFFAACILTLSGFPQVYSIDFDYWIVRDNGPVFTFALGMLWIVILGYQIVFTIYYSHLAVKSRTTIHSNENQTVSPTIGGDISSSQMRTQMIGFLCLLLVGGSSFIYFFATATSGKNESCHEASAPFYTLPTGAHYNVKLDALSAADQILLQKLEKSLCIFTKLRQPCGGFPMYATSDFCTFMGDSGPFYPNEIDFQLGTPRSGETYLAMYQLEPNPIYLQLATSCGNATIKAQDQVDGGWSKYGVFDESNDCIQPSFRNWRRHTSYDDDTMQGTMRFLLELYNFTKDPRYLVSLNKGFENFESNQYDSGAWPQETHYIYPYYNIYPTLNDGLMIDMFDTYLLAIQVFPERLTEFQTIMDKAFNWLSRVQGNGGNGTQIGAWAQQYNFNDQPCWARAFEPPSMESSGTAGLVSKFIDMYCFFNDSKYLAPIPEAIVWLNTSKITYTEDGVNKTGWSRLYELGTNIPIFGLADGNPEYSYTPERSGYAWYGTWGNSALTDWAYLKSVNFNITTYLTWKHPTKSIISLRSNAQESADSLTNDGFWIDEADRIHVKDFASNTEDLINYFIFC